MLVGFRVDASHIIGTGHVMRCLTLAKDLRSRGATCIFISRRTKSNLISLLRKNGFDVRELRQIEDNESTIGKQIDQPFHADWLGLNWESDALQTIESLGGVYLDWLVVDHYAIDIKWEEKLYEFAEKILVIDDLADRKHTCDLLLDQNLAPKYYTRYQGLLQPLCMQLLGPKFALLGSEYLENKTTLNTDTSAIKRIFVYFGGSDKFNLTLLTMHAFSNLAYNDVALDVVINSANPFSNHIKQLANESKNIFLHEDLPSLLPLLKGSHYAIGAGGSTTWERCFMGIPSMVITVAENQRIISDELNKLGYIRLVGHFDSVTEKDLENSLKFLVEISDLELDIWRKKCQELVDGFGVKRVVSLLTLNKNSNIKIRELRPSDNDILYNWVNDPIVRKNSFNEYLISREEHDKWFKHALHNPEIHKIFIFEIEDKIPIGQVRFSKVLNAWELDYSLDNIARGKGLAIIMVALALELFKKTYPDEPVFAKVKNKNRVSLSALMQLGTLNSIQNDYSVYKLL